jgi:hypothetical protein
MNEERVLRQVDLAAAKFPMAHDLLAGVTILSVLIFRNCSSMSAIA